MSFHQDFQHRTILPSSVSKPNVPVKVIKRSPTFVITNKSKRLSSPVMHRPENKLSIFTTQPPRGVSPNDPWVNLDGRLNAPAGSPQFPNLLNNYVTSPLSSGRYRWPSVLSYVLGQPQQPQWMVAGVDYKIGIDRNLFPTNANLTDWRGISGAGFTNDGVNGITITGNNVLLSGIDFSLGGTSSASGATIFINGGSSAHITQSNFAYRGTSYPGSTAFGIQCVFATGLGGHDTLIDYCEIDGNGSSSFVTPQSNTGMFTCLGITNITIQYCLLTNVVEDVLALSNLSTTNSTGIVTFRYNLIHNNNRNGYSGHGDWLQIASGPFTNVITDFNTVIMDNAGTEGFMYAATNGSAPPGGWNGATIADGSCSNNTILGLTGSSISAAMGAGTTVPLSNIGPPPTGLVVFNQNYFDPTTISTVFYGPLQAPHSSKFGNVSLLDASSL